MTAYRWCAPPTWPQPPDGFCPATSWQSEPTTRSGIAPDPKQSPRTAQRSGRAAEVLVDGLAADPEVAGQCGFRDALPRSSAQLVYLVLGEGFLATAVDAACLARAMPSRCRSAPDPVLVRWETRARAVKVPG